MRFVTLVVATGTLLSGQAQAAPPAIRVERVSVGAAGIEGDGASFHAIGSADGRYVAFTSVASNLDGPDTEYSADVFVRDMQQGTTVRVTHSPLHSYLVDMSADGRYIVYGTQIVADNGGLNVYVYDRAAGSVERVDVSPAGEPANGPAGPYAGISDDGRYVAFGSAATNLVPGDDANGAGGDTYLRDRATGTTTRISPNEPSGYCPRGRVSLSADGRYTAFGCYRPFSEPLFVYDRERGVLDEVAPEGAEPSMSDDGRVVAFMSATRITAADDNGYDVFALDRATGRVAPVSVTSNGEAGNRTSQAPSISGDGRYVAFFSAASDLVARDEENTQDVFVADLATGQVTLPRFKTFGRESDGQSYPGSLSASGRFLVFLSDRDELVKADGNGTTDVFRADLLG